MRRAVLAVGLLSALAVGFGVAVLILASSNDRATTAAVLAAVLAVAGFIGRQGRGVLVWWRGGAKSTDADVLIGSALADLEDALLSYWRQEGGRDRRDVLDEPLDVRWRWVDEPAAAPRETLMREPLKGSAPPIIPRADDIEPALRATTEGSIPEFTSFTAGSPAGNLL
jgi:hypothetical protein